MIDTDAILSCLETRKLGHTIAYSETTESTNADAKLLFRRSGGEGGAADGTLVICSHQTNGRGRRGKTWLDDGDSTLCMSVIMKSALPQELFPRYTIAAAFAVCRTARALGLDAKIKWPNDVQINGRKLSGILLELCANADGETGIIIGIGVNVAQTRFDKSIEDIATSIAMERGESAEPVSRERVAAMVINELENAADLMEKGEDGFDTLIAEYEKLSNTLGREVDILGTDGVTTGTAMSLDGLGRLIIRCADGETLTVNAGDVSLRHK